MNGIIKKIRETVSRHEMIKAGDSIVAGFSGGPDSTCLLEALNILKEDFGIKQIAAVHINHMYRGEAAFADERYSEKFCEERGIRFFCYRYDVEKLASEQKKSSEEIGRILRYEAFAEVAEKLGGAKIAVAHNKEDQAETLLMRMVRGTGTEGLCGIDYVREGGIIRPLLDCSRSEIEEFCRERSLNPCIDKTNLEPIYKRNVVRLRLIPEINRIMNCSITEPLAVLSAAAREDRDFINTFVEDVMKESECRGDSARLSAERIRALHPAVRKRVIVRCFDAIGLKQDISSVHLEAAEKLITSKKSTGQTEFPHAYVLKLRYDKIVFEKKHVKLTKNYRLYSRIISKDYIEDSDIEGCGISGGGSSERRAIAESTVKKRGREELCAGNSSNIAVKKTEKKQLFDYEKITAAPGEMLVRYRQPGDIISPKGFAGTKKLKDYFIDRKTDRDVRDTIPLVCIGNKVVWIYGCEVNEKFLPDDKTKTLIELWLEEEKQE